MIIILRRPTFFLAFLWFLNVAPPAFANPATPPVPATNNANGTDVPLSTEQEAKSPYIDTDQLLRMLTGHSIRGEQGGMGFYQYFSEDGHTVYKPDVGQPELGRWKVTSDGALCTVWHSTVKACYFTTVENQRLVWHGPVMPGGQLGQVMSRTILVKGNQTSVYLANAKKR